MKIIQIGQSAAKSEKERFRDLKETIEQLNKDIVQCRIEIYDTATYAVGFKGQTIPCPRMCFAPSQGVGLREKYKIKVFIDKLFGLW